VVLFLAAFANLDVRARIASVMALERNEMMILTVTTNETNRGHEVYMSRRTSMRYVTFDTHSFP
jgi:hypothetical protein